MAFLLNHPSFCYYLFISTITTLYFLSSLPILNSLSTVSISETSNQTFICALQHPIQQGQSNLNCTSFPPTGGIGLQLNPNVSYSEIVGGDGFQCALRPPSSSTSIMGCWRFSGANASDVVPYKRIYRGPVIENLNAGDSHVCGLVTGRSNDQLECWQWPGFNSSSMGGLRNMSAIAVGENFVCGLSSEAGKVTCRGNDSMVVGHEPPPSGSYSAIAAGFWHACAISSHDGRLDCWGDMTTLGGDQPPQEGTFISLALGESRGCALRYNGTVVCWGSNNFSMPQRLQGTSFEAIVAKASVFCGVVSLDYSLVCWGNEMVEASTKVFDNVLPGPCRKECPCQPLPDSARFCDSPGFSICKLCPLFPPPNVSPPQIREKSGGWSNKMVAFLVVGCVGCSCLLIVLAFFLYQYCRGRGCRVHDSSRLDDESPHETAELQEAAEETELAVPPKGRVLEKRLSHVISMGNGSHLEEFSLQVLVEATNNFSEEKKIGTGSFGSVYHAILVQDDGTTTKEVAIKRADMSSTSASSHGAAVLGGIAAATKRQQDKDSAFVSELEALSRLHHKNLVRLLGYYEDMNELILVYEYMNNGSLNDHLHRRLVVEELENPSPSRLRMMSWACRIKVALDAARGIEYLHHYASPPIIHRDIKSSNILLDANWTAKVSDFGLSLMGPEDDDHSHLSLLAAGTVGYMDPQYYRLQYLTTKSDVYSFGVVLLEMLSGHRAIHKNENGVPRNVVDFVVPYVVQDRIHRVLDPRVPPPTPFEIEAVVYVGYLAVDCVSLEGRDRPTMTQVVNSLERALAVCLTQPTISSSRSTAASSDD